MIAYDLLDGVLQLAGEAPAAPGEIEITGTDPIFPTAFRLGEVGAAVIGAAAIEAARIWQDRGGAPQQVNIEVDAAAAAMRSSRYIRQAPQPGIEPRGIRAGGGGLGVYRTADDRWVYFQRLFPHHRERLSQVLNALESDEAAVTAAVARWNALELEDAVVANGATGGMVRTVQEWAPHPHAQALAALPLFEIQRIGDSPPEPFQPASRPLSGVRVLDVTRVLAGPTCGRTLAEHGAEVLRVGTLTLPDNDAMMRDTGHGKRSTALDLTNPSDVEHFSRLVRGADVFSQGYRPGSLNARGFGAEQVAALRPGIVYVSISAFGHAGPWQARRGFDSVVQAVSGIAADSAVDGVPRFAPANPLDYATGYLAAFAAMAALRRRATEGGSYLVRLSLAQTGRWLSNMPRVAREVFAAQPSDLPAERLAELMTVTDTEFGVLQHLLPAAHMPLTPPRWDRPTVPLDHDAPEWLPLEVRT